MSPDEVIHNPRGYRCSICDGTHEHVHAYDANGEVPTMPDGSTTAQAVKVAAGGAPPLTPEGNPAEPGIYPVLIANGEGTHYGCAQWDGECWRLWCEAWDPAEWDVVEHLNCRVVGWALPGCVIQPDPAASVEADPSRGADAPLAPEGINARLLDALTKSHLALSDLGSRIQCTAGGFWQVRHPHSEMPAVIAAVDEAMLQYHAVTAASKVLPPTATDSSVTEA